MSRGNSRRRSDERTTSVRRVLSVVAVAAVALIAIGSVGLAVAAQNAPAPSSQERPRFTPAPQPSRTPAPQQIQPDAALARLADPARPFNIVMFGDSTGVSETGWHTFFAEWLGKTYDRTTAIHPWDGAPNVDQYQPGVWTMNTGRSGRVDIYNASVSSTKSDFPMTRFEKMVPISGESVDMVFVNYGHNHTAPGLVNEGSALVREVVKRYPNAAVIGFLQNAERAGSPHASTLDSANYSWKTWLENNNFFYVDVQTPFEESSDLDAILSDDGDIHPNQAGYQLWAKTLIDALNATPTR